MNKIQNRFVTGQWVSSEMVFMHTSDERRLVMNIIERALETVLHPSLITILQTLSWVM